MEAAWISKNYGDDTYNALASGSSIENLLMEARRIKYDVIGLAETRRRQPFTAVYDTGEELFLGTCGSRGVGDAGVLINTSLSVNIDPFEQLTIRVERLRLKRLGPIPVLIIFVIYAPTTNYDERRSRSVLYGLGEVLQRKPRIL
ncbi:unnamed protein product [Angiostrongylus costaricensis]|uniref:Endo/exonuclease/phosphatase domain-containing protein n=1 Tax=Angiostrongylus costaricensis TaxID=334426 RepID=A0A0R3PZQ5_ANGCS|nr:unnamed protein product [Angiostrongylus costaricensis]